MRWRTVSEFKHAGRTMLVKRLGAGSGPHFVLVHGIGVGTSYFHRLAKALAPFGEVITVELPGYGRAPRPETPMSIEDFAEILSAYLIAEDVPDPVLVGNSMGTQIVVEASLQHPDRFRRLVLLGTVVDPRERTAPQQALRLLQDCLFCESIPSNIAVFADYVRTGVRWYLATLPSMLAYRTEEAVTRLTAETVVMRGARDPISKHEWNEQLAASIPSSRLIEVPRKGHVVMYTAPEAVVEPILELARAEQAGLEQR
ncbi:alpha/beta fold hydrolase [Naasia sp. SYSU D00948]|uniref:alpha/beta fold hydrolase n=1 Tax=Naasia sp. SYSU D00948 TaxID=2817379 RepID=UPI001B303031|nr:alpha/beta hydrolase [Naasia sp. SYSU D00948]